MIGYLQGTLKKLDATTALLAVNGVGYEVRISLQTYYRLEGKREVELDIYTHVREDALALYGFATAEEKSAFEKLIGISGITAVQRARETCRLAGYADDAQVRADLAEWNYGRYEGLTSKAIAESDPDWSLWRDGGPGGETAADVGRRVDRLIRELKRLEGDALIFAHGHVLRVLAARWLGESPEAGRHYFLQTAALSLLGYEHADPVIRRWNQPPPAGESPATA